LGRKDGWHIADTVERKYMGSAERDSPEEQRHKKNRTKKETTNGDNSKAFK
jgi:hypothetical protein